MNIAVALELCICLLLCCECLMPTPLFVMLTLSRSLFFFSSFFFSVAASSFIAIVILLQHTFFRLLLLLFFHFDKIPFFIVGLASLFSPRIPFAVTQCSLHSIICWKTIFFLLFFFIVLIIRCEIQCDFVIEIEELVYL